MRDLLLYTEHGMYPKGWQNKHQGEVSFGGEYEKLNNSWGTGGRTDQEGLIIF